MRIVLCHNCWCWVPVDGDRCPDCHRTVDLGDPDPSPAELEEMFGPVICELGAVRCERRKLPSVGHFLGVAGGLLFLPDVSVLPNGALEGEDGPPERFWPLSRWWPLWGSRVTAAPLRRALCSKVTDGHAGAGERFLNSPGAAFVPRDQLIRAALRGRVWTISRTLGRPLRLTALGNAEEARQAWHSLLSRDPVWRQLSSAG